MATGSEYVNTSNIKAMREDMMSAESLQNLRKNMGLGDTLGPLPEENGGTGGTSGSSSGWSIEYAQIPSYAGQGITKATCPGATSAVSGAFRNCTKLVSFEGPDLTSLSQNMFNGCSKLSDVNIPNDIAVIPNACFYNCALSHQPEFSKNSIELGETCFNKCNFPEAIFNEATIVGSFGNMAKKIVFNKRITTKSVNGAHHLQFYGADEVYFNKGFFLEDNDGIALTMNDGLVDAPPDVVSVFLNGETVVNGILFNADYCKSLAIVFGEDSSFSGGPLHITSYRDQDVLDKMYIKLPATYKNLGTYRDYNSSMLTSYTSSSSPTIYVSYFIDFANVKSLSLAASGIPIRIDNLNGSFYCWLPKGISLTRVQKIFAIDNDANIEIYTNASSWDSSWGTAPSGANTHIHYNETYENAIAAGRSAGFNIPE